MSEFLINPPGEDDCELCDKDVFTIAWLSSDHWSFISVCVECLKKAIKKLEVKE